MKVAPSGVRGLRRGEGCGLRRPDTDLGAALSTIRWQITQLGWDPVQGALKSDAGERTVALDADIVTGMTAWRQGRDKEKEAAGDAWADTAGSSPIPAGSGRPVSAWVAAYSKTRAAASPPRPAANALSTVTAVMPRPVRAAPPG